MTSYDHILRRRSTRTAALLTAGGLLAGSAVIGLLPSVALASSHREAPLILGDPLVDNTDVYAFSSPENEDNVTFVANWIPFQEPLQGPNFHPWADDAEYLLHIDNNGDAIADLTYRWKFTTEDLRGLDTFLYNVGPVTTLDDEDLLFRQYYTLDVSKDDGETYTPVTEGLAAPSYVGPASMGSAQDYVDNLRDPAIEELSGGGKTLATQTEDPFFLDIRVFDLLYGGDLSERGVDTLAGFNVNSIVLEVPKSEVAINGDAAANPNIGVWSTTTRPNLRNADGTAAEGSGYAQVSRLGQPLVNEVIVPTGLKDAFNTLSPAQDAAAADGAVVARVLAPEVPRLVEAIYGIPAPPTPRYDIFETFLTGIVSSDVLDVDGDDSTENPINVDLNSQALNAAADPAAFQPSEMLRLNMSITGPTGLDMEPLKDASRLGVVGGDIQGFPNGRRLADDVVDIELLALEGIFNVNDVPMDRKDAFEALKEGDKVDSNENPFSDVFPYIAAPNTQAVSKGGSTGAGGTDTPSGNGNPGTPPAGPAPDGHQPNGHQPNGHQPNGHQPNGNQPNGNQPNGNQPYVSASGQYPVGGVDTGAGGWDETLLPALTGGAALLLFGAGAGSLLKGRLQRRQASGTTEG